MKKTLLILACLVALSCIPTPILGRRCITCGQLISNESFIERMCYYGCAKWQHLSCLARTGQLAVFDHPPHSHATTP